MRGPVSGCQSTATRLPSLAIAGKPLSQPHAPASVGSVLVPSITAWLGTTQPGSSTGLSARGASGGGGGGDGGGGGAGCTTTVGAGAGGTRIETGVTIGIGTISCGSLGRATTATPAPSAAATPAVASSTERRLRVMSVGRVK